jgi:hypothetical protein
LGNNQLAASANITVCYLFSGIYDVHIKWKGRHIPKSPFRVRVSSDLDSSKCYAEGPGLQSGIVEKQWTNFTVYTKGTLKFGFLKIKFPQMKRINKELKVMFQQGPTRIDESSQLSSTLEHQAFGQTRMTAGKRDFVRQVSQSV